MYRDLLFLTSQKLHFHDLPQFAQISSHTLAIMDEIDWKKRVDDNMKLNIRARFLDELSPVIERLNSFDYYYLSKIIASKGLMTLEQIITELNFADFQFISRIWPEIWSNDYRLKNKLYSIFSFDLIPDPESMSGYSGSGILETIMRSPDAKKYFSFVFNFTDKTGRAGRAGRAGKAVREKINLYADEIWYLINNYRIDLLELLDPKFLKKWLNGLPARLPLFSFLQISQRSQMSQSADNNDELKMAKWLYDKFSVTPYQNIYDISEGYFISIPVLKWLFTFASITGRGGPDGKGESGKGESGKDGGIKPTKEQIYLFINSPNDIIKWIYQNWNTISSLDINEFKTEWYKYINLSKSPEEIAELIYLGILARPDRKIANLVLNSKLGNYILLNFLKEKYKILPDKIKSAQYYNKDINIKIFINKYKLLSK